MFSGLILSGCTTNVASIAGIYLISLSYQKLPTSMSDDLILVNPKLTDTFGVLTNNARLEVRAGYFGICVLDGNDQGLWICGSDTAKIAMQYQSQQDPLNLIWAVTRFKNGIVFCGLMYVLCFVSCLIYTLVSSALSRVFSAWLIFGHA